MGNPFAAAIAQAAAASPQANGEVPIHPGRLLLVDGDGLAYYCAGKDDTAPGTARHNLNEKIASAARSCGAETVKILLTGSGSHKGYRFAVGAVKPYQGQRTSSSRPANWRFLRDTLEADPRTEQTTIAEADDLFSRYALSHPDCVIYTQDKDMRMIPGWHLDWTTHILTHLGNEWELKKDDKVYGRKWFWLQMLQGDTADNIPGLPFYVEGGKAKRIGEKGALDALASVQSDMGALLILQNLYQSYYKDRWLVEMLEQGVLLWMRNDQQSSPLNVTAPGNPLHSLTTHELWPEARKEIMLRIAEAVAYEETEDHGSGEYTAGTPDQAEQPMCDLRSDVQQPSARSLPFNGTHSSDLMPSVQLDAGVDRTGGGEVRTSQPPGIPVWLRAVLATPRN